MGSSVIEKQTRRDMGRTRFRYLSAKDERLAGNANSQGIVLKVEHRTRTSQSVLSTMLPGDSDAATWRDGILEDYSAADLSCDILLAGHHGSDTFFEIPGAESLYTAHVSAMKPAMVIISVGKNPYGHPGAAALRLYRQHAAGSSQGNKVFRTDQKGTMRLTLSDEGGWQLKTDL